MSTIIAEPIHFADYIFAERRKPVVFRCGRGRISPLVIFHMREGHVAHPEGGESTQDGQIVAHHVPALNAHERGNLVLFLGLTNIVGGGGEDEIVGMLAHRFADGVDLIEGLLHRGRAENFTVDPDREKDGRESAITHPGNVDVAIGVWNGDIEMRIEEPLRGVVVGVDDDRGGLQLFRFIGDGVGLRGN